MRDDQAFLEDFESCRLAAGEFHHSDHVRVAWMMLKEAPLAEALDRFTRAIRRFADHHGATGLYHQTITWTYLFVINERMSRAGGHEWPTFRRLNPDLFDDHRAFLGRYYTEEVLKSDFARREYALPDVAAARDVSTSAAAG